jgi:hypothetical protein|nr:MAG TPA: hypothetical protein [Caudoviricetes sp.]
MGSLDNNIRLIRNETVEGGNTKERIAETFDNIVAELGKKVDKVAGKILSSNDFTNELRQKLEGLQQVDISLLLPRGNFTGTAQDLKDLIDGITRILQSPDTELDELREIVAYIKQNKHILSTLGINNIAGLEEALANKADKDHNHDDRYAPITHHHNEYAHRTHRHNWDDIDGKPNNLATTENVKTAIDGIQIGGRNLILNSKQKITKNEYAIASFLLSEEPKENEQVTFTLKGELGAGKSGFRLYNKSGYQELCILQDKGNGIYQQTFNWKKDPTNPLLVVIYVFHQNVIVNSTIEWIKLERGNTPTDWSPAPEDFITPKEVMHKITRTGYEVSTDTVIPQAQQNDTIFVKASCTLGLQNIEHLGSVSFIKTFDTGAVTFTCAGKNIIYPFDNTFNGKKGSTAVVSIHNNDCYIRISNV